MNTEQTKKKESNYERKKSETICSSSSLWERWIEVPAPFSPSTLLHFPFVTTWHVDITRKGWGEKNQYYFTSLSRKFLVKEERDVTHEREMLRVKVWTYKGYIRTDIYVGDASLSMTSVILTRFRVQIECLAVRWERYKIAEWCISQRKNSLFGLHWYRIKKQRFSGLVEKKTKNQ